MIAVDTNVLVRLLTGDDPAQFKASERLFATDQIYIPITVLLETEWVLRAAYKLSPVDVCDAFSRVLGLANVTITDGQRISQAIAWNEKGLDFADALHLSQCQEQEKLKTFDNAFIKQAKALAECRVEKP